VGTEEKSKDGREEARVRAVARRGSGREWCFLRCSGMECGRRACWQVRQIGRWMVGGRVSNVMNGSNSAGSSGAAAAELGMSGSSKCILRLVGEMERWFGS